MLIEAVFCACWTAHSLQIHNLQKKLLHFQPCIFTSPYSRFLYYLLCVSNLWRQLGPISFNLSIVAYRYRAAVVPHVPARVRALFPHLNNYVPLSTFSEQASAGLSSSAFDIEANIHDGDSRTGLDERGTQEVMEIMRRERVKYVASSKVNWRC